MSSFPRVFLFVVLLGLAGCASTPSSISDRLYFGRAIPGGGQVDDAQWNAFVVEVIAPRFPAGFTVWRGAGFWRGDDGAAVSEDTCVLEVVHRTDAAATAKLEEIARIYRERFNQDAVLGVRTPAELRFWRR